ncbi:hypothetical protein J4475_01930 [Candidatus Woesearchaeota archaeon]|nr:hypothetical protein [Candidatus Woesearchaeota archaeon]
MKKEKEVGNNLIAALVLLFVASYILFLVTTTVLVKGPADHLTGKASSVISFCLAPPAPNASITFPLAQLNISGNSTLNASVNTTLGNANLSSVDFFLVYRDTSVGTFISADVNHSDSYYGVAYNTTAFQDANCGWLPRVAAYFDSTYCSVRTNISGNVYFTINNIDQPPNASNFVNNISTNFTALNNPNGLGEYLNVSNATFGINNQGKVIFVGRHNFDNANVDANLNISVNSINITNGISNCISNPYAELTFYGLIIGKPVIYKDGAICGVCQLVINANSTIIFTVNSSPGNYEISDNSSGIVSTFDQTDPAGGNQIKYKRQEVTFYANLTTAAGSAIDDNDARCSIIFNLSQNGYNFTGPLNMTYNSSLALYTTNRTFNESGNISYNVSCDAPSRLMSGITDNDSVWIRNRQPTQLFTLPDETWNEDTILIGQDLDDYFTDPDGDTLAFTSSEVSNILVQIHYRTHIINYTPDLNFFGIRTVVFTATDPEDEFVSSNVVTLTVIDTPEAPGTQVVTSVSSGGGGGGGGLHEVICVENWDCTEWSQCLHTGLKARTCTDLTDCGTTLTKPAESENCTYTPTCTDLVKNQGETGVDCGGPCPACGTCFDSIQNQGETGVDCGGPCLKVCGTCFDGIQSQGEEGIDCGGPCTISCTEKYAPKTEQPLAILAKTRQGLIISYLAIIIALLGVAGFVVKKYYMAQLMALLAGIGIVPSGGLPSLEIPRLTTEMELRRIRSELARRDSTALFHELAGTMRLYFQHVLNTDYQPTYEQLENEIRKLNQPETMKSRIIDFIRDVADVEYGGKTIERPRLKSLLSQAERLFDAGLRISGEADRAVFSGQKYKEALSTASRALNKANFAYKSKDYRQARRQYIEFYNNFIGLPDSDQLRLYQEGRNLYHRILQVSKRG